MNHLKSIISLLICYTTAFGGPAVMVGTDSALLVRHCNDFSFTGKEAAAEWENAPWVMLGKIDEGGSLNRTRFKIMYSSTGIYVMFSGDDDKITSDFKNDFDDIYRADVFEVFFHPYPEQRIYFEYEVSPMDKELVLLILNINGKFGGWMPWHYEGKRKVVKKVSINGGQMAAGAAIKGWTAELFFPYGLLDPLMNVPPKKGTRWNANFCRLDYDSGNMIKWSWSPVKASFHEFEKYRSIEFE
jgi:hypothetical protein